MIKIDFDIDIDMADRSQLLDLIPHVAATIHQDGDIKKHNTGVYFQNIPQDPLSGWCDLDYREAGDQGYFKVDFLNNTVYREVQSPEHLDRLCATEPDWSLLEYPEIVGQLYHINQHYDIVNMYKPRSVEQLAQVLALIRPAKRHLVGQPFDRIQDEIWQKPTDGEYYFKRSHATAFAMVIVVQMNLLSGL